CRAIEGLAILRRANRVLPGWKPGKQERAVRHRIEHRVATRIADEHAHVRSELSARRGLVPEFEHERIIALRLPKGFRLFAADAAGHITYLARNLLRGQRCHRALVSGRSKRHADHECRAKSDRVCKFHGEYL